MKNLIIFIRLLLTLTLLWFVYHETGWATTLVLVLTIIRFELEGILNHE